MTSTQKAPVADWATDFDHTHPDYAAKAPEVWDELRGGVRWRTRNASAGSGSRPATRTWWASPTTPSTSAPRA